MGIKTVNVYNIKIEENQNLRFLGKYYQAVLCICLYMHCILFRTASVTKKSVDRDLCFQISFLNIKNLKKLEKG